MRGTEIALKRLWRVGELLGSGGFGQVWSAASDEYEREGALKLVPKAPGADRELLFVDLENARNVVPIIDSGEYGDNWVLVMPRAERSLRHHLTAAGNELDLADALAVLRDICDALVDLEAARVIHRDLKPENVLELDGKWCLADFGISRYAGAATATHTRMGAWSAPYAAPERWRFERADSATDVYAFGVMAYEMLSASLPFSGPSWEEFREQHLHTEPPLLGGVPAAVEAVIAACLHKSSPARPAPADLAARLARAAETPTLPGLAQLQEANRSEVQRAGSVARQASEASSEAERRQALARAAVQSFSRISAAIHGALMSAAPDAQTESGQLGAWALRLGGASVRIAPVNHRSEPNQWGGWSAPSFEVVAHSSVELLVGGGGSQYQGRSHSLWFGDIQQPEHFGWFETAFMFSPLIRRSAAQEPFALTPGEEAAKAVWSGMAEYQVAWPFTPLIVGELDEFIGRWAAWLASAAQGTLSHPTRMPEIEPQGSWRR